MNNKFKISAPTWNKEFEIPDGSYSVSDIQCYFKNILEKHGKKIEQKIESRLKLKKGYYVEFLSPEAIKLPGSTTSKITKDKNG